MKTFAIGHFGLGYLLGTAISKITKTKINLALIFTVSVLPDLDILFPNYLTHRGPTHSLLFSLLVFAPFFVIYRKKAFPYFFALISHSLIGDIYGPIRGIQLFWPFSTNWITFANISNLSLINISFELSLFTLSTLIIFLTKDFQKSFFHNSNRIYWLIPFGSILGPLLFGVKNTPYNLPLLLVIPSLFYLAIFSLPIMGIKRTKIT